MFDKKTKERLMYWSLELLLIAGLIFMCTRLDFLFKPIGTFISTLFAPIIISGFLFYLLNPVVNLLMKVKIKKFKIGRTLAVAIVFILLIALLALLSAAVMPSIIGQFQELISKIPAYIKELQKLILSLSHKDNLPAWVNNLDINSYVDQFQGSVSEMVKKFAFSLTSGVGSLIGAIASVAVTLVTVPFIVFYMLKDGPKLLPNIKKFFAKKHADAIEDLLKQMSATIAKYISGQAIECLAVGTMSIIGIV